MQKRITYFDDHLFLTALLFLILGFLAILIFYLALPENLQPNQSSDFLAYYFPVAQSIVQGEGITFKGEIAVRYPPGYPLLLAGCIKLANFTNLNPATAINFFIWLCFGSSVSLVYLFSKEFWNQWKAFIPPLLWMTFPFSLWLAKQPNSGIPFTVFLLLGLYLFWLFYQSEEFNWKIGFLSGVTVGFAMLMRPIVLFLGGILFFFFVLSKTRVEFPRRLVLSTIFLLGCAFLPLVWGIEVYRDSGQIVVLSTGGPPSIRDGLTFAVVDKGYREFRSFPEDVLSVMDDLNRQSSLMKTNSGIIKVVSQEFLDEPVPTLKLFLIKSLRSWYALDSMRYEKYTLVVQLIYLALISLGIINSWKKELIDRRFIILVIILTIYFWGMTTAVLSILRYMTPVFSLLFIFVPSLLTQEKDLKKMNIVM